MSLFYKHSVFNQAASNFVHSVSSSALSNLIASPSLADASNCRPYHLVVKTNKKYFWNHVSLFPTPFTLSDILDDDGAERFDEVDGTKTDLVNFERSLIIEAKGKVEASLAMEIAGFELDANRHIAVAVDFGQVVEKSLDIPKLVDSVKGRKINLKKDFIKEVMAKKRNTLCLVVTTLSTEAESKITTELQTSGSADGKVTAGTARSINIGTSLSGDRKRTLEIPANTPLAFRMLEILVRPDRSIQLMQLPNSEGGFEIIKDDKEPSPSRDLTPRSGLQLSINGPVPDMEEIRQQLKPILLLPEQGLNDVRHSLKELLRTENSILLNSLNIMFQVALNSLLVGHGGKQTTQEILREKLGCSDLNDTKPLLQVAGFSFEEDSVMFPTTDESRILICTSNLLDLLGSLNEDQGRKLYECSEEEKRSITKVIAEALAVERLPLDQPSVSDLFNGSRKAESLVFSLGFQLERTDGHWYLSYSTSEMVEDDLNPAGLLVIMCALWDQK